MITRSMPVAAMIAASFAFIGSVKAGTLAYSAFDGGQFGTIDLSTGATHKIRDLPSSFVGLGVSNGELFGASGTTLFEIDPNTGALTTIGSPSVGFSALGSTNAGLFGLTRSGSLVAVDPNTAAMTFIGSSVQPLAPYLSNGGDTLYDGGGYLKALDTGTGDETLIWSPGGYEIGGMVFDDGTFYTMLGNPPGELATFDVTTLTRHDIAQAELNNVLSLAVLSQNTSVTPEPSSFLLLGSAFALAVARRFVFCSGD